MIDVALPSREAAEFRRQATQAPNKPEPSGDDVSDDAEPSLPGKLQALLVLALDLGERISRGEQICIQGVAAVRCNCEVTDLARGFKCATHQIAAGLDMLRPRHDELSKPQIGPGLEALQPPLFDQFVTEATESKPRLVIPELRAGYHAKPYTSDAGTIAVPPLETEINRSTDGQRKKDRIGKQGRRQDLSQLTQGRDGGRVGHQGHLNKILNRAASDL